MGDIGSGFGKYIFLKKKFNFVCGFIKMPYLCNRFWKRAEFFEWLKCFVRQ